MSTPCKSAGKKRALSDDENASNAPAGHPKTPTRQSKKRNAGQALPTPTTTGEPSTVNRSSWSRPAFPTPTTGEPSAVQARGSSSRPAREAFRLGTPLSSPTPRRGQERPTSTSLSAITEDEEDTNLTGEKIVELLLLLPMTYDIPDPDSDVDSDATIEMTDDVYEEQLNATKADKSPADTTAAEAGSAAEALPGQSPTVLDLDEVLTTGQQPAVPVEQLQFRCAYPQGCNQTQRDIGASRKVIADKFGRNKNACKIILFPRWCRRHYQQTSYKPSRKGEGPSLVKAMERAWAKRKIVLISDALDVIDGQQPGVRFNLILRRCEMARVNASNNGQPQPAPVKGIYQPPLDVLKYYVRNFMGAHADRSKVDDVLEWAKALLDRGEIQDCPCFEIIPEWSAATKKTYAWVAKFNGVVDKRDEEKNREEKESKEKTTSQTDSASVEAGPSGTKRVYDIGSKVESSEAESALNKSFQSSTSMEADDSESEDNADDADDEAELFPTPTPRVKKSYNPRINQKGAIQKPAKK